ncbi:hypothetical protein EJ06DRAFT_543676 [Trichodelitschia bisporula]|uniref:Acyltransferase 3 domain-containing protein n=1 Tax=Trichodelitschia bisporula TaxID=703511 RepID=A0A6G1HSD3_9PEZI|nr:hypothetical protein EJ06DRAFT_543676 [Trichodelitschia bisporula]
MLPRRLPPSLHFLPRRPSSPPLDKLMSDTTWADGLRGIAAFFVMSSHITLCIATFTVAPSRGAGQGAYLFQRPIFRLVAQGPAWVALFFVLSGFVLSLKPLRQAKGLDPEAALMGLNAAAFRRIWRLVLPAAAATVVSWAVCQVGGYEVANASDSYWIRDTAAVRTPGFFTPVRKLVGAITQTWSLYPANAYDQPQWALMYLLQGSFYVFMVLTATVRLRPKWRAAVVLFLMWWSLDWSGKIADPLVGISVFAGVLLAELTLSPLPMRMAHWTLIPAVPVSILALILMSFPSEFQETAPWSAFLLRIHLTYFPQSTYININRLWPTIGSILLTATIIVTPTLRQLLRHRALIWLGKISFPLYLLHGMLLRTVFAWLLHAFSHKVEVLEGDGNVVLRYPMPGPLHTAFALMGFLASVLVASHAWAQRVEPLFGRITAAVERMMAAEKGVLPVKR